MSIGNALIFINRGLEDNNLRGRLNAASRQPKLNQVLAEEDLLFSAHDFDETFHHQLTRCKTLETVDQLKEFKLWWDLLMRTLEPAACKTPCSGCSAS